MMGRYATSLEWDGMDIHYMRGGFLLVTVEDNYVGTFYLQIPVLGR